MARQSSFNRDELVACGHGELFGPGNARLPVANMLMVDRVIHISEEGGKYGKGEIIAELDIHPDLWFFGCHFISDPVILPAMWQLLKPISAAAGRQGGTLAWCCLSGPSLRH